MAAALCAAQIATAAQAAEIPADGSVVAREHGTFAGARLRVPFGGAEAGRPRAGLTLTSLDRTQLASGAERLRFGEGMELGIAGGEPVKLRLGGLSLGERLAAIPQADAERKQRKTGKVILKGAAVLAIIGVAVVGGALLAVAVACDGNRCDD